MSHFKKLRTLAAYAAVAPLLTCVAATAQDLPTLPTDKATLEGLGAALFFDENLSKNRNQSCATCHAPESGFADPRDNGKDGPVGRAASLGDDEVSIGDRNAPTASYAAITPDFHKNKDGLWVGGQFLDGRESNLEGQAGGPPLNPLEMGMPDKMSVVTRLQENDEYVSGFKLLYGDGIFNDADKAYAAMTDAIAAFERTEFFSPFDSKYDRYLRGEAEFSRDEELGRTLFFSQQFTNCNLCHQLHKTPGAAREPFSNYQYFNIGVPVNKALRAVNGSAADAVDHGLLANPQVKNKAWDGKFKTGTLRNVAVTGPYMHNGVFADLETVVRFYNRYNSKSAAAQINPETGKPFGDPEVPATLDVKELTTGPALDDQRIKALVAFLKTLTDQRYEHLLDD
ncbi:cytochrome-c peroxidase [Cohaesibacter celericrescens]|uniref:Methylamine utilization protein MauG n=1 Tax=Cohaesibacter celericrescens TaxID=2067669 RepID=A0A2N5XNZ8_9HYPH|nr:cytochrome c peroxidase [Cohaesibacter celericrescens]PLW76205.1 methylamine utilization protein MauG [Cohaesibacter celericrescens]